jgi:hypothetical protein
LPADQKTSTHPGEESAMGIVVILLVIACVLYLLNDATPLRHGA